MIKIIIPELEQAQYESYRLLKKFGKEIKFPFPPEQESVTWLIGNNTYFCRLLDHSNDGIVGGMLAIKNPHPINRNLSISSEIYLYISPRHRGGSMFIRLLKQYQQWVSDEKINMPTLVSTNNSPDSIGEVYGRFKYYEQEKTFVKFRL